MVEHTSLLRPTNFKLLRSGFKPFPRLASNMVNGFFIEILDLTRSDDKLCALTAYKHSEVGLVVKTHPIGWSIRVVDSKTQDGNQFNFTCEQIFQITCTYLTHLLYWEKFPLLFLHLQTELILYRTITQKFRMMQIWNFQEWDTLHIL